MKDRDALVAMVVSTPPNTTVPVKVIRDKEEKTLNVRVGELDLDAEQAARASGGGGNADSRSRKPAAASGCR